MKVPKIGLSFLYLNQQYIFHFGSGAKMHFLVKKAVF
jgi:hypothetical protein